MQFCPSFLLSTNDRPENRKTKSGREIAQLAYRSSAIPALSPDLDASSKRFLKGLLSRLLHAIPVRSISPRVFQGSANRRGSQSGLVLMSGSDVDYWIQRA